MDKEYLQNKLTDLLNRMQYYLVMPTTKLSDVEMDSYEMSRIDAQIDLILSIANDFGIQLKREC